MEKMESPIVKFGSMLFLLMLSVAFFVSYRISRQEEYYVPAFGYQAGDPLPKGRIAFPGWENLAGHDQPPIWVTISTYEND
jgi:hypothetical protein